MSILLAAWELIVKPRIRIVKTRAKVKLDKILDFFVWGAPDEPTSTITVGPILNSCVVCGQPYTNVEHPLRPGVILCRICECRPRKGS